MNKLPLRLAQYNAAALAAVGVGVTAPADTDAAQISITGLNLSSSNSVELFLDIQGFAAGASTFGYAAATSSFSAGTPLGGASDIMLRGAGTANFGIAQARAQAGGFAAVFSSFGYFYNINVGSAFNLPTNTAGTFLFAGANSAPNPSLTYPAFGGGLFAPGTSGTAYFQFTNSMDGLLYDLWLDISMNVGALNELTPTITGIHVDTRGPVGMPEPGTMALLCMGAAGLAAYRRRRAAA